MAEVLKGNLDQLPLIDILKMLSSSDRTGRLSLSQGRIQGEIYLAHGSLVHAATGAQLGEQAVFTMMSWMDGDFSFTPDVEAPEESVELATEQILLEAARKNEEWRDIKKMVPSSDIVFKLSPTGSPETVSLEPAEWQVLAQVNGKRSIEDLSRIVGRNEFDIAKILYSLTKAGLLEVGEEKVRTTGEILNDSFFDTLQDEFTDILGPLGPVIIEDEIHALGEDRDRFPRDRAAELVERLSEEIKEDKKRTHFQKVMLEALKSN
ncbi:MAG: DUF4388 domain-containing protein [Anaerolineales bacterium]